MIFCPIKNIFKKIYFRIWKSFSRICPSGVVSWLSDCRYAKMIEENLFFNVNFWEIARFSHGEMVWKWVKNRSHRTTAGIFYPEFQIWDLCLSEKLPVRRSLMPEMTGKDEKNGCERSAFPPKRTKSPNLNGIFGNFAFLRTRSNLKSAEKGAFLRKKPFKTPWFWLRQGTLTIGKGLFAYFFLKNALQSRFLLRFTAKSTHFWFLHSMFHVKLQKIKKILRSVSHETLFTPKWEYARQKKGKNMDKTASKW